MNDTEKDKMLDFLLGGFHVVSAKMDGQHVWRFWNGCPTMRHCVGTTPFEAVQAAMREMEREMNQSKEVDGE